MRFSFDVTNCFGSKKRPVIFDVLEEEVHLSVAPFVTYADIYLVA